MGFHVGGNPQTNKWWSMWPVCCSKLNMSLGFKVNQPKLQINSPLQGVQRGETWLGESSKRLKALV
jgi:hypothetical protein